MKLRGRKKSSRIFLHRLYGTVQPGLRLRLWAKEVKTMTNVVSHLTVDLVRREDIPSADVMQGDQASRNLRLTLYTDGEPFLPGNESRVVIRYVRADGVYGSYEKVQGSADAWLLIENRLTVFLLPEVCQVPGITMMSISFLLGTNQVSTFPIRLNVHPLPGAE